MGDRPVYPELDVKDGPSLTNEAEKQSWNKIQLEWGKEAFKRIRRNMMCKGHWFLSQYMLPSNS